MVCPVRSLYQAAQPSWDPRGSSWAERKRGVEIYKQMIRVRSSPCIAVPFLKCVQQNDLEAI